MYVQPLLLLAQCHQLRMGRRTLGYRTVLTVIRTFEQPNLVNVLPINKVPLVRLIIKQVVAFPFVVWKY